MKEIIVENYRIITPLGDMRQTIDNLYMGKSAVKAINIFGLPVSLAYLADNCPRHPKEIVKNYADFDYCNSPETLFIYSVAKGDINKIIDSGYDGYSPLLNEQAKQVAIDLGLDKCAVCVVSNACASGAAAIDTARLHLQNETYNKAVIFGFEQINEFVIRGFYSLSALSSTGARPFDRSRNGMSLGEGSGICVLKYAQSQPQDVCVLASGASNDANHRTGPSRTGDGLALAIERALKSAGLSHKDISAIKCHATATPYNDAMEAKALKLIFGEERPPMVSLKAAIGHLSGAGSLIETMIGAQFLQFGKIAPTLNFEKFEGEEKITISDVCQTINGNKILCLSAGFGGLNTAVILKKS
jgi:3-oxoacyl-[acyl-carrier-protein] synthase-1